MVEPSTANRTPCPVAVLKKRRAKMKSVQLMSRGAKNQSRPEANILLGVGLFPDLYFKHRHSVYSTQEWTISFMFSRWLSNPGVKRNHHWYSSWRSKNVWERLHAYMSRSECSTLLNFRRNSIAMIKVLVAKPENSSNFSRDEQYRTSWSNRISEDLSSADVMGGCQRYLPYS